MIETIKKILPDAIKWTIRKNIWTIRKNIGRIKSLGKPKIFGIGNNKTGTTSLKAAMG